MTGKEGRWSVVIYMIWKDILIWPNENICGAIIVMSAFT